MQATGLSTCTWILDPFGRDCEPGEREELAAQITRIISEEITRPKVWEPGLRSFAVNGAELARRAPIAGKYCSVVAGHKPGSGRILLQGGGAFSPNDAVEALRSVIGKKVSNKSYAAIKQAAGLRSLYLLIYYDLAIIKNTPNLDVDIPAVAASAMSSAPSAFDAAFVLMFPGGGASSGRCVYRIQADSG